MSMSSFLTFWKAPKTPPPVVSKTWRPGMWVMFQNKVAIIAVLNEQTEIHYVDEVSGETVGMALVPMDVLRQARYNEIPLIRRNVSAEQAMEMGYGT